MGAHYYKEQIFVFPISTGLVRFVSWATKTLLYTSNFSPAIHKVKVAQSCLTLQPHGLYSPWNSLGQNTGVGILECWRYWKG